MTDNVNHPPHYKTGIKCDHCDKEIECINISRNFNFALGNVIKYVWRAKHKGEYAEQLRKARWYLNDEIDRADGSDFLRRLTADNPSNKPNIDYSDGYYKTLREQTIQDYGKKLNQIKEYVDNIWSQYMAVSNPKQRDSSLCVEAIQTLVEQFNGD